MSDLQLDFDEEVILDTANVSRHAGNEIVRFRKMMLTNRNLIFVTVKEVGFFSREVETVQKVPLSEIKVIDGQACVEQLKAGLFDYQLQIHYNNGTVKYSFSDSSKKLSSRWKDELTRLLTVSRSPEETRREAPQASQGFEHSAVNNSQLNPYFCPNCGAQVAPSANYCPECGAPVRGSNSPMSSSMHANADDEVSQVRQFCDQLMNIESGRKHAKARRLFSTSVDSIDMQKLSLIRNFPIPDTFDGILEFIALAIANIDVNLSRETLTNRLYRSLKTHEGEDTIDRTISDAWVTKLQQAYQKALQRYSTEPGFPYIEQLYSDEIADLKIK